MSPRLRPPGFSRGVTLGTALSSVAVLLALGCTNNPVHDDQVEALGPEDARVPPGPLHRPGQPCLVCHGAFGPASVQFAVGGTVYEMEGAGDPAAGAVVRIEDVKGKTAASTTNSAGNFAILLSDFGPAFPIRTSVTSADGRSTEAMQGDVARNGSCASCHTSPAGSTSAGPVVLSTGVGDAGAHG